MPSADAAATATWVSSVKGFDHTLYNGEDVNDAGGQSFFLSWGANFNYLTGFEYLNVFALYDWRHVPGTTVELLPGATKNITKLVCNSKSSSQPSLCPQYRGSSHFVGGVDASGSDANRTTADSSTNRLGPMAMGVFAFDMTPIPYHSKATTTLRAHKSWFWPGDGSLISCVDELSAAHPIVTTVEQAWADAPTLLPPPAAAGDGRDEAEAEEEEERQIQPGQSARGSAFRNGGFVYRSITDGAQLEASVAHKAGNWTATALEYGDYPGSSGDVFTLSFAHTEGARAEDSGTTEGRKQQQHGKPLCYSVSVAAAAGEQKRARPKVTRSAAVTSVASATSSPGGGAVHQAVFWSSNATVELSAEETLHTSAPCVVIATAAAATADGTTTHYSGGGGWEIFVVDPSRELKTLTLTLTTAVGGTAAVDSNRARQCSWSVPLPTGGAAGSSVKGALHC